MNLFQLVVAVEDEHVEAVRTALKSIRDFEGVTNASLEFEEQYEDFPHPATTVGVRKDSNGR